MLVRFSVENFLSFRDRTELSMVASGKARRHPEHVIKPSNAAGIPLLKLALIFGANASGKSNLVKAMKMAQTLILMRSDPGGRIPYFPFKLETNSRVKPSRFEFEISINERYYAYGFSVTSERIEEEWLFAFERDSEQRIFERKRNAIEFGDLSFTKDEEDFLKSTARWILPNRLFLAECRGRKIGTVAAGTQGIRDTLRWLTTSPLVWFPDSKFEQLAFALTRLPDFRENLAHFLSCFDTGIEGIDVEIVAFEKLGLSESIRREIEVDLDADPRRFGVGWPKENPQWLIGRSSDGTLQSWKWSFRHGNQDRANRNASLEMSEESDGTLRLMDLVPVMSVLLSWNDLVIAVDEIDRSLHPEIVHSYLANFLRYSVGRRSQLIVTTHDTTILKQRFLRRDEVWFLEKASDQSSRMIALEEYKNVRQSKDLQQDYLLGRFGGIPVIRDFSWLGDDHGKGT